MEQDITVSEYSPHDAHNNTLSLICNTSVLFENTRETEQKLPAHPLCALYR